MSSKRYLFIDSSDNRLTGHNDIEINLTQGIKASKVELLHFSVPNTFYNINSSNNTFDFDVASTVTVTPGSYTLAQLLTEIETQMQAVTATYTATVSSITGRVTIQDTAPAAFNLDFSVNNSMGTILGFDHSALSGSASYTGSYPPDISDNEIFIELTGNVGTSYATSNNGHQNPTFIVPNDQDIGGIVFWNKSEKYEQKHQLFGSILQHIRIRLTDKNNRSLENVGNFNMLLGLE